MWSPRVWLRQTWVVLRDPRRRNALLIQTTATTVKALCGYHIFTKYIGGPRLVVGPSMLPTMSMDTELVLENTLSVNLSPPRFARGDLVTVLSPVQPGMTVCKRVIGLPGDTVCVDPLRGLREGDERATEGPWGPAHVVVPPGHIWIAGDNTSASRDSRTYGPVPIALVQGKIFARVYPNARWFRNPTVYIDSQ